MQKNLFLFLAITSLLICQASAQDVIMLKNGDEVDAKITEVGIQEIKYKRMDNLEGPVYVMPKADIFKIKYKNGTSELMTATVTAPASTTATAKPQYAPSGSGAPAASTSGAFSVGAFKSNNDYYLNQVYLVDATSGRISSLEKGTPEMKTNTVAAPFYASSTSSWMLAGAQSNVRISSFGGYNFVIKFTPGLDPSEHIKMSQFNVMPKSKRDPSKDRYMPAYTASSAGWGGASSGSVTKFLVDCEFKKLDEGVYEVIPKSVLAPGEYTFYVMHKFYAFGVDLD
jgi:hypothetical protein